MEQPVTNFWSTGIIAENLFYSLAVRRLRKHKDKHHPLCKIRSFSEKPKPENVTHKTRDEAVGWAINPFPSFVWCFRCHGVLRVGCAGEYRHKNLNGNERGQYHHWLDFHPSLDLILITIKSDADGNSKFPEVFNTVLGNMNEVRSSNYLARSENFFMRGKPEISIWWSEKGKEYCECVIIVATAETFSQTKHRKQ